MSHLKPASAKARTGKIEAVPRVHLPQLIRTMADRRGFDKRLQHKEILFRRYYSVKMENQDNWFGGLPSCEGMEGCDAASFAALLPSVLLRLQILFDPGASKDDENTAQAITEVIKNRSAESQTVSALSSAITGPIQTSQDFRVAWIVLGNIIGTLPLESLSHYRQPVQTLASRDPSEDCPQGISLSSLIAYGNDLLHFMDNPELAWAPKHKADDIAIRSLTERVHSAEQMRPHVPDLLSWLADPNWPPHRPCIEQLARFPEATVDAIRDVLSSGTDDLEWLTHVLVFVQDNVPVWPLWRDLRPEFEGLIEKYGDVEERDGNERDETTEEMVEAAKLCMRRLHMWTVLKEEGVETI